jgi:hypothetical protein
VGTAEKVREGGGQTAVELPVEAFRDGGVALAVGVGEGVALGGKDAADAEELLAVDLFGVADFVEAEGAGELAEEEGVDLVGAGRCRETNASSGLSFWACSLSSKLDNATHCLRFSSSTPTKNPAPQASIRSRQRPGEDAGFDFGSLGEAVDEPRRNKMNNLGEDGETAAERFGCCLSFHTVRLSRTSPLQQPFYAPIPHSYGMAVPETCQLANSRWRMVTG